jgi:hypothetical protein
VTFPDVAYVAAASAALRQEASGWAVLDSVGFWMTIGLRNEDERAAFASMFVAQGETLRSTPALGALMTANLVPNGPRACATYAAVPDGDDVVIRVAPDAATGDVVVVVLADSVLTARPTALRPVGSVAIDPDVVGTWRVARCDLTPTDASPPDDAAQLVPRTAAALEILGAAGRAFELACEYASDRRQFGRPISDFQAVRHLLAEGLVQIRLLRDACELTLEQPTADRAVLLKALAGRNGRAVLQVAQQVLGGVGFTAEHPFHRYQARVLALDSVLGSSGQLIRRIGVTGMIPVAPRLDC